MRLTAAHADDGDSEDDCMTDDDEEIAFHTWYLDFCVSKVQAVDQYWDALVKHGLHRPDAFARLTRARVIRVLNCPLGHAAFLVRCADILRRELALSPERRAFDAWFNPFTLDFPQMSQFADVLFENGFGDERKFAMIGRDTCAAMGMNMAQTCALLNFKRLRHSK
jgi:hypothetical protein